MFLLLRRRCRRRFRQRLGSDPQVQIVSKYYQGFGVVAAGARTQPVSIIGFGGEELASMETIGSVMQRGELSNLQSTADALIMGEPLARYQGLSLGDPVMIGVTVTRGDSVTLRWLRLNLVGTFEMGAETDYSMVLVNLDGHTDDYWRTLGQVGTRVMLNNPMQAGDYGRRLRELQPTVAVETWEEVYGELFQAVRMEKTMMFVLLLLVVAIAGFNIIAGQSMMVHDKRAQIAMLHPRGRSSFCAVIVLIPRRSGGGIRHICRHRSGDAADRFCERGRGYSWCHQRPASAGRFVFCIGSRSDCVFRCVYYRAAELGYCAAVGLAAGSSGQSPQSYAIFALIRWHIGTNSGLCGFVCSVCPFSLRLRQRRMTRLRQMK